MQLLELTPLFTVILLSVPHKFDQADRDREVDNLIFPGSAAQGIFNRPTEAILSWSETNVDWKRKDHANWKRFER